MSQFIRCGSATHDGVKIASLPGLRGLLESQPGRVQFHPNPPYRKATAITGETIPPNRKIIVMMDDGPSKWRATIVVQEGKAVIL